MDKEYILSCYQKQRENLKNNPLKNPRNRIAALKLLQKNITEMEAEICEALKQDLNKSKTESYMTEIGLVQSEISYMLKHCKKFSKPKRVRTPLSQFASKSFSMPCPYGQVLIISPWNYPFMLSIEPLVDAISAGNCVMLKPSDTSSHVSKVIAKLVEKTFPKEQVFVIQGGREQTSFILDLDFDHIFFTGSMKVGKIVLQKAAERYIPVTLELGGKSPCIVDETANISLAAKRIVFGKFLNCGQTCVAPDYVYCAKEIKENLVEEIKKQIVLQYSAAPLKNDAYPKIISQRQFDGVKKLLAKDRLLYGGEFDEKALKIEPTILDSNFECEEMRDEIFGPILPIVTFETLDEAIDTVNSKNKPLALYFFSSSKKRQKKVLSQCDFGGGCVNDTIIHLATSNMGFGGLKSSGMGAYHGKIGFETFSHRKSIVDKKTWLDLPMRYQPYSKFKEKLIRMFLK